MLLVTIWLSWLCPSLAFQAEIHVTLRRNLKMRPTHFLLYTRENIINPVELDLNNLQSVNRTNFSFGRPTKVLVHGWNSKPADEHFPTSVKDAYLAVKDVNVIVFDWSKPASNSYVDSIKIIDVMASIIAGGLEGLLLAGMRAQDVHLIGHSLGAHIVGVVGEIGSFKPTRVTGLDPAGPLFSYESRNRISVNSADFVDIVHTCGRVKGFYEPLGHVDFYPNGGTYPQPGCGIDILAVCSHARAPDLFAQSILQQDSFPATRCNSWNEYKEGNCRSETVIMGEGCPSSARGNFYLYTYGSPPFTLGR